MSASSVVAEDRFLTGDCGSAVVAGVCTGDASVVAAARGDNETDARGKGFSTETEPRGPFLSKAIEPRRAGLTEAIDPRGALMGEMTVLATATAAMTVAASASASSSVMMAFGSAKEERR